MKLLALDVSLRSTGWAIWDTDSFLSGAIQVGAINPKCFGLDRYKFILNAIGDINREHGEFDLVVFEGYPFFLFGMEKASGRTVRTDAGQGPGNQVFALAEITGLIKMMVHFKWEVPFACLSPKSIKKYATGYGAADKAMMIEQLTLEHALKFRTNDEVDAWYIGQFACDILFAVVEEKMDLPPHRKESIKHVLESNNPEGTFSWMSLDYHEQQFGRKKPGKKRRVRRRTTNGDE